MDEAVSIRQLLTFARTEFGEHLCALLLSGYGEDDVMRRRTLAVTPRDAGGRERRIILITDDPSGLPGGREPLVLLALLRSFHSGEGAVAGGVTYTHPALAQTLGWSQSEASAAAINKAVEKYYNLSVGVAEVPNANVDDPDLSPTSIQRIVIAYEYVEESDDNNGGWRANAGGRLEFNPDFITHLESRTLFGIDWNLVGSVSQSI